ncbi:hypothetical protein SAMN06297251_12461 [Fulvimarina manganoxydans]|uniref:PIN domain-containing protein n=1 Tax=Fulvimarina manganoxydans TaxID=937218 RepID=A0A1W2EEB9_9HYPH|nr:PIN domain-containing protein [Fulvimarina manganoxydans]MEE2953086.1 PIN domain-containing protein [Pseudomonadota bacterium]SMD08094.1 hypothetical protein SAMN06297251_12461 [Fulvimarina manganoxydans]
MSGLVVIDTNVAVLLAVGLVDIRIIKRHKRLQKYDEIDFRNLINLIGQFSELIFIPNTLTETSNIVRYLGEPDRSIVSEKLAEMASNHQEIFISSQSAAGRREFVRLGLADSALLIMAENGASLITDDAALYEAAVRSGYAAINFTHVQAARPDFP